MYSVQNPNYVTKVLSTEKSVFDWAKPSHEESSMASANVTNMECRI
jgi:hypothetical protein